MIFILRHHYTCVQNQTSNTRTLFFDEFPDSTMSPSGYLTNAVGLYIGRYIDDYSSIMISDIRIWNTAFDLVTMQK